MRAKSTGSVHKTPAKKLYLNGCSFPCLTGGICVTGVTPRPGLIHQIPGQDSRLILVHSAIDSVDAVGHGHLVIQIQLKHLGVGVEVFWMLKPSSSNELQSRQAG